MLAPDLGLAATTILMDVLLISHWRGVLEFAALLRRGGTMAPAHSRMSFRHAARVLRVLAVGALVVGAFIVVAVVFMIARGMNAAERPELFFVYGALCTWRSCLCWSA